MLSHTDHLLLPASSVFQLRTSWLIILQLDFVFSDYLFSSTTPISIQAIASCAILLRLRVVVGLTYSALSTLSYLPAHSSFRSILIPSIIWFEKFAEKKNRLRGSLIHRGHCRLAIYLQQVTLTSVPQLLSGRLHFAIDHIADAIFSSVSGCLLSLALLGLGSV